MVVTSFPIVAVRALLVCSTPAGSAHTGARSGLFCLFDPWAVIPAASFGFLDRLLGRCERQPTPPDGPHKRPLG